MSGHGMSDGLREAVEALADEWEAAVSATSAYADDHAIGAQIVHDLRALLAAHPAPEADHAAGEREPWHWSDARLTTPDAGGASTRASEPQGEAVEALAKALLTKHPDGYPAPLQSDYHRRLVAEQILTSDWFAAREAKARAYLLHRLSEAQAERDEWQDAATKARAEAGEQIAQAIEAISPLGVQDRALVRDEAARIARDVTR